MGEDDDGGTDGAARNRQASFRLEADVRRAAKARDLNAKEAEGLLEKARVAFVFVNGEAQALKGDRKTPLRREDGGLVTVGEWVDQVRSAECGVGNGGKAAATFGPSPVALPERAKNPFAWESWNLTEQMRIQRRDPELAARLKENAEDGVNR